MKFYKGYLLSKNKAPIGKITDAKNYKTIEQIRTFNPDEYVGILANDVVMIDFDDDVSSKIALQIIKDLSIKCRVIKTTRGIHCLFKTDKNFQFANTKKQLAIGLVADIKLGSKNGLEVLKYKGVERQVIYDSDEISTPPYIFYPLKQKSENNIDFINMEEGDGRNSKLFSYILKLAKVMKKDEAKETIKLLNKYVLKDKLSDGEIKSITRDEAFDDIQTVEFFNDKGQFLFDVFSNFLMEEKKIIKINNQLHIYKDGIYINGSEWIEREMIKNIPMLGQAKRKEVFSYLKLLIENNENPSDYNQFIAFRNGIYDIAAGELLPFNDEFIITNKIDWDYNPDAYSETVDKMLDKLSCDDKQVRAILEEMIGYCFFRQNEMGKAFILVGPQANGKSTLQAMLQKLFGMDNISSIDLKDLNARFMPAEIYGKLANIGDDIGDNYIDDSNMFKTIVTGGRIIAEKKGQDPFEFEPYVKCIFSANNIPKTRDKTGAIKRRLIIVPFDRVFSPNDKDYDPYIKYKITNGTKECPVDTNMSYLINLGITGLHRVLENNAFTQSSRVDKKINEYDKDNNPIKIWFEELGDPEKEIELKDTQDIYNKYTDFCTVNNLMSMSKIEFSKTIKNEFGFITKVASVNGKSVRIYVREK